MTTETAARQYAAEHSSFWGGKPLVVYSPHNKPLADLPTIYGFNNGGSYGWMHGVILAEDGTGLGGHTCSEECYMPHDLGCLEGSRPDRHEEFRAHYPDGYRMEFVGEDLVRARTHDGLMRAYALNQEKPVEP